MKRFQLSFMIFFSITALLFSGCTPSESKTTKNDHSTTQSNDSQQQVQMATIENQESNTKKEIQQEVKNQEKSTSKQQPKETKSESKKSANTDTELEPSLKIGEVSATEMDAAVSTDAHLADIPKSAKVTGNWKFTINGVGNASSTECNNDNRGCVAYFPQEPLKPGKQYTLVVSFDGKIDKQDAYIQETKRFTAPKPYSE